MKKLMTLCLLSMSAVALAQAPVKDEKIAAKSEVNEAELAKTRKQLDAARQRLDKAAREVAELSGKLGTHARREFRFIDGGPRRAVLGIQVDPESGAEGVRIMHVSPGGPAAEAGLRERDLIVAIDGAALPGGDPDRALISKMREVKPEQKVKVAVLREGKKHDYVVIARPHMAEDRMFNIAIPEMGGDFVVGGAAGHGPGPVIHQFRGFWPGEFEGLELATITPKLGAYFGVEEGVLVVQSPADGAFKLEDGDVLQAIDGRKPDDGPHALRILRSYRSGEKLNLTVLRQRKPVTLAVTMPERKDMGMQWEAPVPAIAPLPAVPPLPPGAHGFIERAPAEVDGSLE